MAITFMCPICRTDNGCVHGPADDPDKGKPVVAKPAEQYQLWNADPNCVHDEQPASGGGVKCTKCPGWFCF